MKFKNPNSDGLECKIASAAEIYENYGDFIRKVICLQIQDEDQADDLFQNFFLSLVFHPLPKEVQNMKAYLYRAIINEVADTKRLIRNYHNCINEYAEHNNHPRSPKTPGKIVMEVDEANKMFEFIEEQLTRTEAQAICLRYRDDLSTKRIAKKMSVRSVTVRGYIHEGLNRVRGLLRDIAAHELE